MLPVWNLALKIWDLREEWPAVNNKMTSTTEGISYLYTTQY